MSKLFTNEHEWVEREGANAVVGITSFARDQLGDIVFVELPKIGRSMGKGEAAGVIESVKAASEIYAPISGEVVAVNDVVTADPSLIHSDPERAGWLFKLKVTKEEELAGLLDPAAYGKLIA
jgi:glycine cleavage system H protein